MGEFSTPAAHSSSSDVYTGKRFSASRLMGVVLMLPALLLGLVTITLPSAATIYFSLQKSNFLTTSKFVGLENYLNLLSTPTLGEALDGTLRVILMTIVMVGMMGACLALGGAWFGKKSSLLFRLLFCLPLAAWAPVFWGLSWKIGLLKDSMAGLLIQNLSGSPILLPGPGHWLFGLGIALIISAPTIAISGIVYLSALHAGSSRRQQLLPGLIWVITLLALLALLPQDFSLSFLFSSSPLAVGGASTLGLLIYRLCFIQMQVGPASAFSVLLNIFATLIGLGVTLLIILSRIQIRLSQRADFAQRKMLPGIPLALGLLGFLGVSFLGIWPTLSAALGHFPAQPERLVASPGVLGGLFLGILPTLSAALGHFPQQPERLITSPGIMAGLSNSLMQLIPVFLLQLPVSYLAALGIGGLRPLGKRSEWLLLLFGGGLFTTFTPMLAASFNLLRAIGNMNTFPGLLLGSSMLNVPMLFILTLFFKGQVSSWKQQTESGASNLSAFFRSLVLPSLPLALLLALVSCIVVLGDISWTMVAVNNPGLMPLALQFVHQQALYLTGNYLGIMMGPVVIQFLISLVILILFQWFYLAHIEIQ